ncbi:MAG: hypothetical protein VX474_06225, partial [Pseudomonadota bacterium]|nr:hypothetical protein [Pseudomonadota bacterium]
NGQTVCFYSYSASAHSKLTMVAIVILVMRSGIAGALLFLLVRLPLSRCLFVIFIDGHQISNVY